MRQPVKKLFSQNLRKFREESGLSQAALAETLNLSFSAVSAWENGRKSPSIDTLDALAKALNVTPIELISDNTLQPVENARDVLRTMATLTNNKSISILKTEAISNTCTGIGISISSRSPHALCDAINALQTIAELKHATTITEDMYSEMVLAIAQGSHNIELIDPDTLPM